jgi:cell division transport system permease protein
MSRTSDLRMSLSYTLRESLSGFRRTKLSSTISIITLCISLLLLGTFAFFTIQASRFIESIRNKVEIEVFLQEPITPEEVSDLARTITGFEGVDQAIYISKEEAAQIFKQDTGEDIYQVLDFNPLPPSFKIILQPQVRNAGAVARLSDQLKALKGVESVLYRRALLELIDQRAAAVNRVTLGLGIVIGLSAILLVSNTIRLAIYAKRKLIQTMELVGATHSFIRRPFLIEGMVQGLIGGLLAAGIFYIVLEHAVEWLAPEFSSFASMQPSFYGLVIAGGIALGLMGSAISVIRFIRPAEGQ